MDEGKVSYDPWYTRHRSEPSVSDEPCAGLKQFFEELPLAVVIYSAAIACAAVAAIVVRVAVHFFFNV